jgi:hypothetical protein
MDTLRSTFIRRAILVWAICLSLGAIAFSADNKPNLSGSWELNVPKSDLGGAPITKLAVQIDHKDPVLKYIATAVVNGQEFTEAETVSTDGTAATDSRGGHVKAGWDSATLVIETSDDQGQPLDAARMTLSDDGKTMTRDYERKSANDTQKRHEIYEKH